MFTGKPLKYELYCRVLDNGRIALKKFYFPNLEKTQEFLDSKRYDSRWVGFRCMVSRGSYVIGEVPQHDLSRKQGEGKEEAEIQS